jgi:hypothetical protein
VVLYIVDEAKVVRVNRSWRERLLHLAIRLHLGVYTYSERIGCLVTVKDRADELEADGLRSPADREEHARLRAIERSLSPEASRLP